MMKEAKRKDRLKSLKTKGKKSKTCEGSPSQHCCSEKVFAEQGLCRWGRKSCPKVIRQ